jgi:uncharacterized protein (DUF4415 family)
MYDDKLKPHADPEIRAFEESLFRSIDQAVRGEFSAVHTPEMILARQRGRPVGSTKQPVTLRVDSGALARLRASGKGWQTRASEALSQYAMRSAVAT